MVKRKKSKAPTKKALRSNSETSTKAVGRIDDNNQTTTTPDDPSPEIIQIVPVVEEDFDLTKKTIVHETTIVKRVATRTEKIEVPITYEEVYVNNKGEGLLSRIKDTITHSVSSPGDDNIEYHYPTSSSPTSSSTLPPKASEGNPKGGENPNINPRGETVALIEGISKKGYSPSLLNSISIQANKIT
jgi:hypothetical protein